MPPPGVEEGAQSLVPTGSTLPHVSPSGKKGEVLCVACRGGGGGAGRDGGAEGGSVASAALVATAGAHGVWLWDPREPPLNGPVIVFGEQVLPLDNGGGAAAAELPTEASGGTGAAAAAAAYPPPAPSCCTSVSFHPSEEHTVVSSSGGTLRWHDTRAPDCVVAAVSTREPAAGRASARSSAGSGSSSSGAAGGSGAEASRGGGGGRGGEGAGQRATADKYSDGDDGDDDEDEINEVAVSTNGAHVAAADDTGAVRVYNARTRKPFKTLARGGHSNLCTCVSFRPRRPWELVSGGMDGVVIHWDFSKGKAISAVPMGDTGGGGDDGLGAQQLCNPPLVNAIAVSPNGERVAAGLADHSVSVLGFGKSGRGSKGARLAEVARLRGGHSHGVSQVHFAAFGDGQTLVSGGNDRRVCIWDLARAVIRHEHGAAETDAGGVGATPPALVASVANAAKVNWLASLERDLYVADTTHEVKVYSVR